MGIGMSYQHHLSVDNIAFGVSEVLMDRENEKNKQHYGTPCLSDRCPNGWLIEWVTVPMPLGTEPS